ncbi:retinol dehydrogenase 14-like [Dreissena polymorpha]|nr:retinol dehydrogenase 14-like [Dreissena polymorpha]
MGGTQSFPIVPIPKDRTFVVTGANRGIGYEVAKWIAMMGGTVVMACRNEDDTMKAMRQMEKEYKEEKERGTIHGLVDVPELSLVYMHLDLGSFHSTKQFVEDYKTSGRPLHVLICNAGIVKPRPEKTDDGFESMLQVNYLSHFLLIGMLLPMMKGNAVTDDTRIVLVSSDAHRMCRFNLAAINYDDDPMKFSGFDYYGRSKLYQIMQMYSLQRRLKNSHVTITSAHPGTVETEIGRDFKDVKLYQFFLTMTRFFGAMRDPLDGARTIIDLAVNPVYQGVGGHYYKDCSVASVTSTASDVQKQEALWNVTLELLKGHLSEEEIFCLEGADP